MTDPEVKSPEDVAVLRERLIEEYKERGIFTKVFNDDANEHSVPHAHEGATIVTLTGSAQIRLDEGEWQQVVPGTITTIADDQLHEVITGPDGWGYLFACSQREAQRQGLID